MQNSAPGLSAGPCHNFQFKAFVNQTHLTRWKCSSWWYSEGFLSKHKSFRTLTVEKWNMPTNQRRNSVKPIYFDHAANSLLFELPKNYLKCLTCQLPKPKSIWSSAFRQNSTNFIYNWSTFPPQMLFSSHLFWIKLGWLHLFETVKALIFTICRGQHQHGADPSHTPWETWVGRNTCNMALFIGKTKTKVSLWGEWHW